MTKKQWPKVNLGEVCEINPRLRRTLPDYSIVSFVPMSSISEQGGLLQTEARPFVDVKKGYSLFERDSVLVAKITPCFENMKTAIAAIDTAIGAGSTEFHVFEPQTKLLPSYLHSFLRQPCIFHEGTKCMTGSSGHRRVPEWFFRNLEIPLPPLEEQRRIAEMLDNSSKLLGDCHSQLQQLSALATHLYQTTSTTTVTDFSSLVTIRSGQVDPTEENWRYLPHIAPNNLRTGSDRLFNVRAVKEDGVTSGKYHVLKGDILYSKIRPYLNKTVISPSEALCSADMYALIPTSKEWSYWVLYTLRSRAFLNYAEANSSRANIPKINREALTKFPFPIPSEQQLQIFNRTIARIRVQQSLLLKREELLHELHSSLSTRAFTGEL